jgi:hypothetical protein
LTNIGRQLSSTCDACPLLAEWCACKLVV